MKNVIDDKKLVHWWEDAYGRHTCHTNVGTGSFASSFVGEVVHQPDGWYYQIASEELEGPFRNLGEARTALMAILDVHPVEI